jgi:hypothetical protein
LRFTQWVTESNDPSNVVCLEFPTKKHHQTKDRYVQDYTLSEAFAPAQTFDIPAFGGKLDVS